MDATVVDPLIGRVLDGRYRIESRIARGGMATVYVGRDLKLDRVIALKVMHPHLAQDDDFVRRFIGEAKNAAALSHPNVVAVYDQGSDGTHVFLAMEYLPGRTLRDLLNERGRLPARTALDIMQPVLSALGAAHRGGLIHRDVKPENVLLTTDGQVKVADFGLARAETDSKQTKTGMIIGTVAYMAPEQVVSGDADARSDVYASGILLFELLTGRQPHQGDTPLAVAYKHVNDQVPMPSSLVPGIPQRIDALVMSATSKDPAGRPADANHFYALLGDATMALPAAVEPQQVQPNNATSILSIPAPTHPSTHTSILPAGMYPGQEPQRRDEEPVLLLDRIMHFATGKFVLLTLGMIASMVIGWATWFQLSGQYDHVPKIVGVAQADAIKMLNNEDIKYTLGKKEFSDLQGVDKGEVFRVEPGVGSKVKPNQTITVFVSAGRVPKKIPNVERKTVDEAKAELAGKGFTNLEERHDPSPAVPKDQVVGTDPKAGTEVSPEKTVVLIISEGIVMPDLTGKTKDEAYGILGGLNLDLKISLQEQDDPAKAGNTVLGQSPPKGTPLNRENAVTIFVNRDRCPFDQFNPFCSNDAGNDEDGDDDKDGKRIPLLIGRSVDDATRILQERGYLVQARGDVGTNRVIRTEPGAGEKAPKGSTVVIVH